MLLESFACGMLASPRGDGMTEWRGKVEHVHSGEARYFREWSSLVVFLERVLSESGWVEEPLSGSP